MHAMFHGFTLTDTNAVSKYVFLTAADENSSRLRRHLVATPKFVFFFLNLMFVSPSNSDTIV